MVISRSGPVLIVGALVVLGFAIWYSLPAQPNSTDAGITHSKAIARRDEVNLRRPRLSAFSGLRQSSNPEEADASERFAVQAGPEAGETTPTWAELEKPDRIAVLEAGFESAIEDIEAGDPTAAMRASDALTALRFELYDTPEGREHHAELELQLEALTETP